MDKFWSYGFKVGATFRTQKGAEIYYYSIENFILLCKLQKNPS